jgi:hypothetical protein
MCANPSNEITNLSGQPLSYVQQRLLAKGLNFVPTPKGPTKLCLLQSFNSFARTLRLRTLHGNANNTVPKLRIKKPGYNPLNSQAYLEHPYYLDTESYISFTKTRFVQAVDKIIGQYTFSRVSNLTRIEKRTLLTLKNHKYCSLKVQDKNLGGIWLTKAWYVDEALVTHLLVTTTYLEVISVPVVEIFRLITTAVNKCKDLDITSKEYILEFIVPSTCIVPTFYLLIKTLKNPVTSRPIAANHSWITTGASKWVSLMLNPVVKKLSSVLSSSSDLIRCLENTPLPNDCILFSWDVVALYPNIPLDLGIKFVKQALEEFTTYSPDIVILIITLLTIVLTHSYVKFDDRLFRQIFGTAMGTSLACNYANIFVFYFFRPIFEEFKDVFIFNKSYVDDIVGAIRYRPHVLNFLQAIVIRVNNLHPRVKITTVVSSVSIDVLDLTLFKGPRFLKNNIIDIKPYRKPQSKFSYPLFSSFHAPSSKTSWLIAELMRLVRNSSSFSTFKSARAFFAFRTQLRGIPPSLFELQSAKVLYSLRDQYLAVPVLSESTDLPIFFQTTFTPVTQFLKVKKILREGWDLLPASIYGVDVCRLATTFKRGRSLKETLSISSSL